MISGVIQELVTSKTLQYLHIISICDFPLSGPLVLLWGRAPVDQEQKCTLSGPLVLLWGRAPVGQEQKYTDVSEENVTIVPMETCFELLLDVNPGASIQLDGAARLI